MTSKLESAFFAAPLIVLFLLVVAGTLGVIFIKFGWPGIGLLVFSGWAYAGMIYYFGSPGSEYGYLQGFDWSATDGPDNNSRKP